MLLTTAHRDETHLRGQQVEFEAKLTRGSCADPMLTWTEYVKWVTEHRADEKLSILARACKAISQDKRHHSDIRLLRLWCRLGEMQTKVETYRFFSSLEEQGIGTSHALLYEAWAVSLEAKNLYEKVENVYQRGIRSGAEPLDRLRSRLAEFQKRMAKRQKRKHECSSAETINHAARPMASTSAANESSTKFARKHVHVPIDMGVKHQPVSNKSVAASASTRIVRAHPPVEEVLEHVSRPLPSSSNTHWSSTRVLRKGAYLPAELAVKPVPQPVWNKTAAHDTSTSMRKRPRSPVEEAIKHVPRPLSGNTDSHESSSRVLVGSKPVQASHTSAEISMCSQPTSQPSIGSARPLLTARKRIVVSEPPAHSMSNGDESTDLAAHMSEESRWASRKVPIERCGGASYAEHASIDDGCQVPVKRRRLVTWPLAPFAALRDALCVSKSSQPRHGEVDPAIASMQSLDVETSLHSPMDARQESESDTFWMEGLAAIGQQMLEERETEDENPPSQHEHDITDERDKTSFWSISRWIPFKRQGQ